MATFILVAGTHHGGWCFDTIAEQLRSHGHQVFAPTLSGLELEPTGQTGINLDTHIDDVLAVIGDNNLEDVVLVGWSYGGTVITGVSGKTNKIGHLVYLDGVLPLPGQREWDCLPESAQSNFLASCTDGLNMDIPPGFTAFEPRMRPHPLATKLQAVHYDQADFDKLPKTFVFAEKWFHDPSDPGFIRPIFERVRTQPAWTTYSLPFGHDLPREAPNEVAEILLKTVA